MRHVGKQLSGVLVMVCLEDMAAREWAIGRDEVADSGMVVLRLALDRLVEFYRQQGGGKRRT